MNFVRFFFLALFCLTASPILQADEPPPIPRPEHPNPQMRRAHWLNLNGSWEFAETDDDANESFLGDAAYPDRITVPFCRESKLSGLARTGFVKNVWYRRTFKVPENWGPARVLFHIGACDWKTRVWVNGKLIGTHVGGNVAFSFDASSALNYSGKDNVVIIHARDDAQSGLQALGKQSNKEKSYSIFYTRTTGIWQTVWLEAVSPNAYIKHLSIVPDPDHSRALLQMEIEGDAGGQTLGISAELLADGKRIAKAYKNADWRNNNLELKIEKPRLWSPSDPYLYELKLRILGEDLALDDVESYFGMRKISIRGRSVLLNDKPVFQRLVLDQGFYPDGVWTAPSDEALKKDIELAQALGLNGARLHQKVFEPRFHYWADKLGYLTWGEFPSYGANYGNPAVNVPIQHEWTEIMLRDRNHPSIIGWCPFNETPADAAALQNAILDSTRALDPTRPAIDSSGWYHSAAAPEILDAHDYDQNPEKFAERWRDKLAGPTFEIRKDFVVKALPFFISEYGGIGWVAEGERNVWGYGKIPKTEEEWFTRYAGLTNALLDNPNLFGFCYTQLTDVEQERNGYYYFDRRPKFDSAKIRAINIREAAYETGHRR